MKAHTYSVTKTLNNNQYIPSRVSLHPLLDSWKHEEDDEITHK